MIDELNGPENQNREPTLDFIEQRIRSFKSTLRDDVVRLLETQELPALFSSLVEKLPRRRKRYETLDSLRRRDRAAISAASENATVPKEAAQRDVRLSRPYKGEPSALEYFFLTLPSQREWAELIREHPEQKESITSSGGLALRDTLELVLADRARTRAFVEAVQMEVYDRSASTTRVYDIGCGPFPILAIAAALDSPTVRVTCMEINPLSASIAELVVSKLRLEDQITIVSGDALTAPLPEMRSVDVLISETVGSALMDEKIMQILPRYARACLKEAGTTIPSRARLSAALIPNDKGVSIKEGRSKYPFVLHENSEYLPVIDEDEWTLLTSERGIDLSRPLPIISGTLPIPREMSIKDLIGNYRVGVCAELILDSKGRKILFPYDSVPTSPGLVFITAPKELENEQPDGVEIYFEYAPGSPSTVVSNGRARIRKKL